MKQKYQQGDVLLVAVTEPIESDIKSKCKIENGGDKEGKIILAFFSDTILKLFFGFSINYFLANKVSPAIIFWFSFTSIV